MGKAHSKMKNYSVNDTESKSMFGAAFEKVWPEPGSDVKFTKFGRKLLEQCKNIDKPCGDNVDLQEFIKISSEFPIEFGTNNCRVINQPKERHPIIKKQIASAYPIIHERVLGLYLAFLEHKCQYGNKIELSLYPKLSLTCFVQRLLEKRCIVFMNSEDQYLLLTGESGMGGDRFEDIGSLAEKPPLVLANVLSYDEMKLSAFLSVSSHSEFINDGNRYNRGHIESDKSKIERDGVIIGLIGGRFERPDQMEWQDILITRCQNTKENGYGIDYKTVPKGRAKNYRHLWREFYEENDFLYSNVKKFPSNPRFSEVQPFGIDFDSLIMKKRYTISFDTLLLESEARAAAVDKQAFIHVVGIGLGVWQISENQEKIFLETFAQRLKVLVPHLPHVAVVHFAWFHLTEWKDLKDGGTIECETHPNGGIKTFLSRRNPAGKLKSPDQDNLLLIVSYAWDSNALPGNEFWLKALAASGDPAAACSTLITELHNPHINSLMVSGSNLHIASEKYGVMHIADYAKIALK